MKAYLKSINNPEEKSQLQRDLSVIDFHPDKDRFAAYTGHQGDQIVQYASFYFKRLHTLREFVMAECQKKWGYKAQIASKKRNEDQIPSSSESSQEGGDNPVIMNNILDVKPGLETVIIGTLYKEMPKKPCILSNLVGVLRDKGPNVNYCSPEDYLILEDSSGRIKIKPQSIKNANPGNFVTGSIMGMKGKVDQNGLFEVEEYTYAGINPEHIEKMPKSITSNKKYIAIVSGLEFGNQNNTEYLLYLKRFFRGEHGDAMLASKINRLIIAGNSIQEPQEQDNVNRGSYRTHDLNIKVYSQLIDLTDQLENYLTQLTQYVPVELMPGESDFTSALLPQQQLHPSLFPNLLKNRNGHLTPNPYFNLLSNPCKLSIDDITLIGTSGQTIQDIQKYSSFTDPLQIMEHNLTIRHLAPTCPDTLRSYPFTDRDPFILSQFPHVYFCGNQRQFGTKFVSAGFENQTNKEKGIHIVSIPKFRESGSFVVVELGSLEIQEVKLIGRTTKCIKPAVLTVANQVVSIENISSAASPVAD
ncbi:hypothetical protein FGO68_gene15306 [Halteria grandinella]|uniref:DNA polymerase delta small subunit n=1 Tax=Halteria grandinella TaxID=5974 RepID=A0A8J8NQR2_HALGN|nr:hypothetical protein FGO68_gene15306 [Halteria grandinella]